MAAVGPEGTVDLGDDRPEDRVPVEGRRESLGDAEDGPERSVGRLVVGLARRRGRGRAQRRPESERGQDEDGELGEDARSMTVHSPPSKRSGRTDESRPETDERAPVAGTGRPPRGTADGRQTDPGRMVDTGPEPAARSVEGGDRDERRDRARGRRGRPAGPGGLPIRSDGRSRPRRARVSSIGVPYGRRIVGRALEAGEPGARVWLSDGTRIAGSSHRGRHETPHPWYRQAPCTCNRPPAAMRTRGSGQSRR